MRTIRTLATFAAIAAFSGAGAVLAQAGAGQSTEKTEVAATHVMPADELTGLNVINKQGQKLGTINDIVVDVKTGDVRYAALAHGGVAGIGSKLFAIPWQAMTFKFGTPNDQNERHFILDATADQFENAAGFDSSHWPKFGDARWGGKDHPQNAARTPDTPSADRPVSHETVFRCSVLQGMDVRNEANENLGSVSDVAIDVAKGKVKYMALSYGSWFTGGNKLFAVPLAHFTLSHADNKTFFVIHDVSKEALKDAPRFDKNRWPNAADPNWVREVDTYYQRTAQRPRP